jgi:hypothetical protein
MMMSDRKMDIEPSRARTTTVTLVSTTVKIGQHLDFILPRSIETKYGPLTSSCGLWVGSSIE